MLKHILIVVSYGMLAVAVGLVSPELLPAIVPPVNWIAAGLVFLGGTLAHESNIRANQRTAMGGDIHALMSENFALREKVGDLHASMESLGKDFSELDTEGVSKDRRDLDRIVAEVRVLQNLIQQLSTLESKPEGTSASGKPKPGAKEGSGAAAPDAAPAREAGGLYGLDENEVLDIVREGLRKDRVDLYLQPVVSLPQRKIRFYECFSRIRAEDGVVIRPDQYMEVAKREGLMGAIDNMLLFRCVQLVRKVQSDQKNVGFFCNVSANTLKDRKFFSDFVSFMASNKELARNLIFEFSQTELDNHREEIGEYTTRLGQLGFHFSLDRVEDLTKLNFEILSALGFRYIKINAQSLLERPDEDEVVDEPAMAEGDGEEGDGEMVAETVLEPDTVVGIDVTMLKRTMDLHGIDLIAEKLEEEQNLIELLDYRIDYGQGYLFGEPRLSK